MAELVVHILKVSPVYASAAETPLAPVVRASCHHVVKTKVWNALLCAEVVGSGLEAGAEPEHATVTGLSD